MTTITATAQTKVVFPAPPPTTNALTNQQRTRLLRKTKKLEQLLGAAPHLIDHSNPLPNDPVHVPLATPQRRRSSVSTTASKRSFDSLSSGSVASTHSSTSRLISSTTSLERSGSTTSRSSRRSSMLLKKTNPFPSPPHSPPSYETWSETKPPFLRIDTESEVEKSCWSSTAGTASKRYTLALCTPDSDSEDTSPSSPSFHISASGSRRTKMDRLRRKLGHGVPIELVFPGAKGELDDDDGITSDGSFELVTPPTSCEDLPGAARRRSKSRSRSPKSISKSRDSLLLHQIPRKSPPPATPAQAPPPPVPTVPTVAKIPKGRPLSAILEGSDEQAYQERPSNGQVGETLKVPGEDATSSTARRRWSLRV